VQIRYLPSIVYFGMPMGLLGAGLNAHHLIELFSLEYDISIVLLILGWSSFLVVFTHYIWHLINANDRNLLVQEWYDPFRRSFIPAVSLTAILFIISITLVLKRTFK